MGVDYKSVLKPALCSSYKCDQIKGSEKMEEMITLQHQLSELASKMESKKSLLESVQVQINELKEKMMFVKKETHELATKCDMEAKTILKGVEKEAAEVLRDSELKVQETVKKSEEEVKDCAAKLFALIDYKTKKEYMDTKILEIKTGVANTAPVVSEIYKTNFQEAPWYVKDWMTLTVPRVC